jgi:hypothetical protein
MVKPNLRTKSIGTKVSEEEYARLEHPAQKASAGPGRSPYSAEASLRPWAVLLGDKPNRHCQQNE